MTHQADIEAQKLGYQNAAHQHADELLSLLREDPILYEKAMALAMLEKHPSTLVCILAQQQLRDIMWVLEERRTAQMNETQVVAEYKWVQGARVRVR